MDLFDALQRIKGGLHGRLYKPYQTDGVRWMLRREFCGSGEPRGGLLADEMGLGKTVQILATILGNPAGGLPTLILCPKSLVTQWSQATERFLHVKPLVIGAAESRKIEPHTIAKHRIVLAPYSVLITAYQEQLKTGSPTPLIDFRYDRVVLDEAHVIKNKKSKLFKGADLLKADIRWALTGTPITRKNSDLLTLMR